MPKNFTYPCESEKKLKVRKISSVYFSFLCRILFPFFFMKSQLKTTITVGYQKCIFAFFKFYCVGYWHNLLLLWKLIYIFVLSFYIYLLYLGIWTKYPLFLLFPLASSPPLWTLFDFKIGNIDLFVKSNFFSSWYY